MIKKEKWIFLENEMWLLTFGGAFQRSKIYKPKVTDRERKKFRDAVKEYVCNNIVGNNYIKNLSEENHVENIVKLCEWASKEYGDILLNGKMRIGTGQKILNLYLKYLWCLGKIPAPPHCPLDNKIISKIDRNSTIKWTELDDTDLYKELIGKAKEKADPMSLAEWELKIYSRD